MKEIIESCSLSIPQILFAANLAAGSVVAAGLGLAADRVLRRARLRLRYAVLVCALALVALSPVVAVVAPVAETGWVLATGIAEDTSAQGLRWDSPAPREYVSTAAASSAMPANGKTTVPGSSPGTARAPAEPWLVAASALAAAWALGTFAALARLVWGVGAFRRLLKGLSPIESPLVHAAVERSLRALRPSRAPRFRTARAAPAPLFLVLPRPTVVLPHGIERTLSSEQLDAVVLHEVAHASRGAVWTLLLGRWSTVLFWWNPLVHRLQRRLTSLAEGLCDQHVLQAQGARWPLAEALVRLAARVEVAARPRLFGALGMLPSREPGLEGRVHRILDGPLDGVPHRLRSTALASLVFVAASGAAMLAVTVRAESEGVSGVQDGRQARGPGQDPERALCGPQIRVEEEGVDHDGKPTYRVSLRVTGAAPKLVVRSGQKATLSIGSPQEPAEERDQELGESADDLRFEVVIEPDEKGVRATYRLSLQIPERPAASGVWAEKDATWPLGAWHELRGKPAESPEEIEARFCPKLTGADEEHRIEVVRELALLGRPEVVPVLLDLFRSDSSLAVRRAALGALEGLDHGEYEDQVINGVASAIRAAGGELSEEAKQSGECLYVSVRRLYRGAFDVQVSFSPGVPWQHIVDILDACGALELESFGLYPVDREVYRTIRGKRYRVSG